MGQKELTARIPNRAKAPKSISGTGARMRGRSRIKPTTNEIRAQMMPAIQAMGRMPEMGARNLKPRMSMQKAVTPAMFQETLSIVI